MASSRVTPLGYFLGCKGVFLELPHGFQMGYPLDSPLAYIHRNQPGYPNGYPLGYPTG